MFESGYCSGIFRFSVHIVTNDCDLSIGVVCEVLIHVHKSIICISKGLAKLPVLLYCKIPHR